MLAFGDDPFDADRNCPVCGAPNQTCPSPDPNQRADAVLVRAADFRKKKEEPMGAEFEVKEQVWENDDQGTPRLRYIPGEFISNAEAARLGLKSESKAKEKPADKSVKKPPATKSAKKEG